MAEVMLITQDGELDALPPDAYREIYDELRQYDAAANRYGVSLDKFVALWGAGGPTKADWSRYQNEQRDLSREMKNILRRAVGLPLLNMTVDEALAAHVDPNAQVYKVGGERRALRVILVATDAPLTLHTNGSVEAAPHRPQDEPAGAAEKRRVRQRTAARAHVSVPRSVFGRANSMRLYYGLSWPDLIDVALDVLTQRAREEWEETRDADAAAAAA